MEKDDAIVFVLFDSIPPYQNDGIMIVKGKMSQGIG